MKRIIMEDSFHSDHSYEESSSGSEVTEYKPAEINFEN